MSNPEPIKRKPELFWTPEREGMVMRLWDDQESSTTIAAMLGHGATRNMVIGKLTRLKATKRNPPRETIKRSPADNARSQKSPAHLAAAAAVEMSRTVYDQSPKLFDGVPRTIGTVEAGECKWLSSEPTSTAPLCGHPVHLRSPYCEEHWDRGRDKNGAASAERRAQAEASMARSMVRVNLA